MPTPELHVAPLSSSLPTSDERILLINPAVFDTQFHWAAWQQPTNLLRLSTYCGQVGADAKDGAGDQVFDGGVFRGRGQFGGRQYDLVEGEPGEGREMPAA